MRESLHRQELERLTSTLVCQSESFHDAMSGRNLIKRLLRIAGEGGAGRMELRISPDRNQVRLAFDGEWQDMPPLSSGSLDRILKYFEWECSQQLKDAKQGAYQIRARVTREDWTYSVVCEKLATESVYTISHETGLGVDSSN